jgi:hypothetical protein
LNSATLVTQNVTVTAVAYSLSFYGAGAVTLSGTTTGTVTGSGAYPLRSTLTFTPTAGTLTLTVSGSCTDAQLESGGNITSVIPTTSSQVTRAADSALMTGVNFSSWYRQDEGTLFVTSETKSNASFLRIASITNGTSSVNERYISESVGTARAFIVQPSGSIAFTGASWNGFGYAALSHKTLDSAFSFNGSLLPNSSEIPSTVLNTLSIGSFVSGSSILNGTIKKLAFYPKRLSNIELVGLTS